MKLFTIPNIMTLCNLLCGCVGIVFVFEGNLLWASYLIFIAGILDFLDGFVARLLKQHSEIGKQLDSLADMVTFGVLPSFIVAKLIQLSTQENTILSDLVPSNLLSQTHLPTLAYSAFILALFSCLRLAKFNIDTRQSDSFIGVPTPANAFVVAAFPLIIKFNSEYAFLILNSTFLIAYTLIMSYLLISEIPLFALKFKSFSWASNQIKYIFLILSVILLLSLKFLAIPLIIFLYIILSVINNLLPKNS
ncbi:CDP-diacylglycerol/serineO-phosphatidyltransfera se [Emticicia oligotrophica DSM 17448]|uniref:CDP-diacylglycerol/serineO-phosphatidyltransfera se n=1 Tax=Emticicia oligotrophica (strain DSM 17448 / CIP 109782 / MTCC 6937 / GPTSA100-15) TaxID=929562 RepID=A0ABM5N320_EMTOG|nr:MULTISPECIES: CDP-alcohol phosphatidyltransferase family protein [Emticicia]AFK03845.1 CDP-diacylglycerol/serineO-phosphatidyltransfera se [Emticicia oligotrophica DSM 17448]